MRDYKINIQAQLDGFKDIEKKLAKLQAKPVKINVELGDIGGDLTKQLQAALSDIDKKFSDAGKIAGDSFGNGFSVNTAQLNKFENKLDKYYLSNTKAIKEYNTALKDLQTQYKTFTAQEEKASAAHVSLMSGVGNTFKSNGMFDYGRSALQLTINAIINSVNDLKNVDSILNKISKTSNLTSSELKSLKKSSFDISGKYGKKASDYLTGVQSISRNGYKGKEAEHLAQMSLLAQAAGDINSNTANSYLMASNAAYQYQGNIQKLNTVLDGQTKIASTHSLSMQDMAAATIEAASTASELGVQENQLSAMIGTIVSKTKAGGSEVGSELKTLLTNVQNIRNSDIADTFREAGVAQTVFANGITQLRNPVNVLEDLSTVFNTLDSSDSLKTDILANIGKGMQTDNLSALLTGWNAYKQMLQDYSESNGNAAILAEKNAASWEGATNRLGNTFSKFTQNFANSDLIVSSTDALTGLVSVFDKITSLAGPFTMTMGGLGALQGAKGGGKRWKYRPAFIKSTYATGEFSGDVYELCTA